MRIGINLLDIPVQKDGIGVYAHGLLRALIEPDVSAESDEYILFVNREAADQFDFDVPRFRRVVCPVGESNRLLRILWEQAILPLQARTHRLDLLHGVANVLPFWTPCPQVVTAHDLTFLRIERKHSVRLRAYAPVVKRSIQRATAIIAVSQNTKRDIIDLYGVDPNRVVTIHNGCQGRLLGPIIVERTLKSYDLTVGHYLLYVGRVEYNKNPVGLLEAYAQLRRSGGVDVPLVLAGRSTEYTAYLWTRARELGIESFLRVLGYVSDDDLISLYNGAIALIFPTLYEGFGFPVVEAMACGTPVIASNRGSIPEVAGDAALLVDPESPADIARAIRAVMQSSDLRLMLRTKGLKQAERYSWTSAARATYRVYEEAIGRNPTASDLDKTV